MALYTKSGDLGQTSLFGGVRVSKACLRVEAYGMVDQLNCLIGTYACYLPSTCPQLLEEAAVIQQDLFDAGSDLATLVGKRPYKMTPDRADWLEEAIDSLMNQVPQVKYFTIPSGALPATYAHQARSLTRTTERRIVALMEEEEINQAVLIYLNRLSDYFYAVARYVNHHLGLEEVLYKNSREIFRRK